MEELNKELNKELSDIQIAILSSFPVKGTSTEQEICDKLKEIDITKDIKPTIIEKELYELHKQSYITELLNTSLNNNNKIYEITSLGEEYIKSNNNQNE